MPLEFFLRRTRQRGKLLGTATRNQEARGRLTVAELKDDELRRTVRTATFELLGAGEPVPPLHDVVLLGMSGDWMSMAGFEEIPDGPLQDARRFQQTWLLEPAANRDLSKAERHIERLAFHLEGLGVFVRIDQRGRMFIPGGCRPGDGAPLEWE